MTDPFAAAGPLADAYADVDWAATSLGPVANWSPTLLACVDLMLHSRFPITLLWGPELVLIYNEGYVQMISGKHPVALGAPCSAIFPEAWDEIGPMLHDVLVGGESTWNENQLLPLDRSGFLEETHFTFAYSPVRGPDGEVEGIIDISFETTPAVVTARRLAALTRLHQALAGVHRIHDLEVTARDALSGAPDDLLEVDLHKTGGDGAAGSASPADDDVEVTVGPDGPVARMPVRASGAPQHDLVLIARLSPRLPLDDDYLDFVRLVGFALAQHLERLVNREAERSMSAALQDSLLTRPQHPLPVEIAVRYRPATEAAQVGGDWYDGFLVADDTALLVVGDVTGHDHGAAASMGQLRNLLRGAAFVQRVSPAAALSALERTMHRLELETLATAVVAELSPARPTAPGTQGTPGAMLMRWSSAGHLPPVLVDPDGTARLLETVPEMLVGLDPRAVRTDHELELAPGSTLVFYTDGLVERRDAHLDRGLDELLRWLGGVQHRSTEDICDLLLDTLGAGREDDTVLLVVRVPEPSPGGATVPTRR